MPEGSHRGASGHIRHGQVIMESIDAGILFGNSLYVHLPSRSSFSLRMRFLFSSFMEILEPSRLLASSCLHKSDWRMPSRPVFMTHCRALCSRSLCFGIRYQFPTV